MLTNFDIVATAGGKDKAVVEEFTATADGNGQITAEFHSGGGGNARWSTASRCFPEARWCRRSTAGSWRAARSPSIPARFTNQGTLVPARAQALNVSGLTGNLNTASVSGQRQQPVGIRHELGQ